MTTSAAGTTPRFTHDCDCCHFLGTLQASTGPCDLYAHVNGVPTVIARYSDEPSDYASGLCFSYGMNPVLTEARNRAVAQGLLPFDLAEALHSTTGAEAIQKLRAELPFTIEYQVALAFEQGKAGRAQGLLRHLLQTAEAAAAKRLSEQSSPRLLLDIEDRIAQTVSVYRGIPLHEARLTLLDLTGVLWDQVLADTPA